MPKKRQQVVAMSISFPKDRVQLLEDIRLLANYREQKLSTLVRDAVQYYLEAHQEELSLLRGVDKTDTTEYPPQPDLKATTEAESAVRNFEAQERLDNPFHASETADDTEPNTVKTSQSVQQSPPQARELQRENSELDPFPLGFPYV
jgi:hypothetical protein